VKIFSQRSENVSSGSRMLEVVGVATATYSPSTTFQSLPTEYASVPTMTKVSAAPRMRPKSSSRSATRNAPSSRRNIRRAEITVP
jgi:hypothetical protein